MQKIRREGLLYFACFVPRLVYVVWKMDTVRKSVFEYGAMADDYLRTGQLIYPYSPHQIFTSAYMPPGPTWIFIVLKSISPLHWPILMATLLLSLSVGLLWFLI